MSFLPDEYDVNSFPARAARWLTTVGRFVIVFTELIVIGAFISRFWLDRTNSDLSESVRQQKAILESTVDFEKEYSLLQQRLKYISNFYKTQPEFKNKLTTLVNSTPPEIIYDRLDISQDPKTADMSAKVSLFSYSESAIIDFVTNLIANPKIATVNIQTIEKKPRDPRYSVSLLLVFAKGQ